MSPSEISEGQDEGATAVGAEVDALRASITDTRRAVSDPERLSELRDTGLLELRSEAAFDRITALAQRALGAPAATVSLVGQDFQQFLSYVGPRVSGAPETRMPLAYSFCQYAVESGERLVIRDARTTPLLARSPSVSEKGVLSYAGQPLETSMGHVLGALCVMGDQPREWSEDQLEILCHLAAVATSEIEHRLGMRAVRRVETIVRELHEPVELLGDAIRSLAASVERNAFAPRVGRLATLASSRFTGVRSLERGLQEAVKRHRGEAPRASLTPFAERLERAVRIATIAARPGAVDLEMADVPVGVEGDAHLLDRALAHLVITVLTHADDSQPVRVRLEPHEGSARLDVVSDGQGMPITDLASVVSRLSAALRGDGGPSSGSQPAGCAIRLAGGRTVAQSGPVRGMTWSAGSRVTVTLAEPRAD
jgi:hypothetical protein